MLLLPLCRGFKLSPPSWPNLRPPRSARSSPADCSRSGEPFSACCGRAGASGIMDLVPKLRLGTDFRETLFREPQSKALRDGGSQAGAWEQVNLRLRRYSWRWTIEVTFHDTKTHLGINEPQNRTPLAVRRTAATGFLLDSLIVWWHETACPHSARPLRRRHGKRGASFADMLAPLRLETRQNMRQTYFSTPTIPLGHQEIHRPTHTPRLPRIEKLRKSKFSRKR